MLWTHLVLSLQGSSLRFELQEVASLYQQWGWEAISFVKRYSTQHFALLALIAKRYNLKPVYAIEVMTHAPGGKRAFPAIVIACTQQGIQSLSTLVTFVHKHQKQTLSADVLIRYKKDVFLLVGEELEQEEQLAEKALSYYQKEWDTHFWVLCSYTETKPIERLRRLVSLTERHSLRTVASIPQEKKDTLLSYEEVQRIFHNHPEFLEEVSHLLSYVPFLSPYHPPEETTSPLCEKDASSPSWLTTTTLSLLERLIRYRSPFLIHTAPVNITPFFHEKRKTKKLIQSVIFQIRDKKLVLFLPSRVLSHLLRWFSLHYPKNIGWISRKDHRYSLLLSRREIENHFSLVGEIEGIPILQTTEDILHFGEDLVLLKFQTHWVWDILENLRRYDIPLKHEFPLALRWTDHPVFTDLRFLVQRHHVIPTEKDLFREISRVMHPFLRGPFVYREEAQVYLSRFIPLEKAKQFLSLLHKDDPRWPILKHEIEKTIPPEELRSHYWLMLLQEGKYLPSKKEEKLRWFGPSLLLSLCQKYPLEFTVATLNYFHHTKQKNRIILYARLVWGVEFLPPSANLSRIEDIREHGKIRLGLRHFNHIPLSMKELIVSRQPYKDFFDFLHKHPHLSRRTLVEWLKIGLFDDLEPENGYKLAILQEHQKTNSELLFDEEKLWYENQASLLPLACPQRPLEEVCGLYAKGHPLDPYQEYVNEFRRNFLKECEHIRYGVYIATPVGIHHEKEVTMYEIVDETGWKRVFFEGSPPFSPELYKPYIWKIVLHEGKLYVMEIYAFERGN